MIQYSLTGPPPLSQTAVAMGYFDGMHLGHQRVVGAAVEAASLPSAAQPLENTAAGSAQQVLMPLVFTFSLSPSSAPVKKQGSGRLLSDGEKYRCMEQLGVQGVCAPAFADFCSLSGEMFVRRILKEHLQAKVLCCGEDFRFGREAGCGVQELADFCHRDGIRLITVPQVTDPNGQPVHSTRIRQLVEAGEMEQVRALLGRPYSIDFPVVHGRQLGRKLHSPTINQVYPEDYVLPRFGVYASQVELEGRWYPAVSNIGRKPTIGSEAPLSETYIIGYQGDLYGQQVRVEICSFIRPEQKFGSVEALKEQIGRDARTVLDYFSSRPLPVSGTASSDRTIGGGR